MRSGEVQTLIAGKAFEKAGALIAAQIDVTNSKNK